MPKLNPEDLSVTTFHVDSGDLRAPATDPNTLGRDCTYEPVCPATATTLSGAV